MNIGKAGLVDYVDPDAGTGTEVFKEKSIGVSMTKKQESETAVDKESVAKQYEGSKGQSVDQVA